MGCFRSDQRLILPKTNAVAAKSYFLTLKMLTEHARHLSLGPVGACSIVKKLGSPRAFLAAI